MGTSKANLVFFGLKITDILMRDNSYIVVPVQFLLIYVTGPAKIGHVG